MDYLLATFYWPLRYVHFFEDLICISHVCFPVNTEICMVWQHISMRSKGLAPLTQCIFSRKTGCIFDAWCVIRLLTVFSQGVHPNVLARSTHHDLLCLRETMRGSYYPSTKSHDKAVGRIWIQILVLASGMIADMRPSLCVRKNNLQGNCLQSASWHQRRASQLPLIWTSLLL